MDRKESIDVLEKLIEAMQGHVTVLPSPERIEALRMAIRCLKVDEMYDLSYEDADWYDKAIKENERLKKELEMLKLDRECEEPSGKWIYDGHHLRCSNCNDYHAIKDSDWNLIASNYCPNCGAKMEVEHENT